MGVINGNRPQSQLLSELQLPLIRLGHLAIELNVLVCERVDELPRVELDKNVLLPEDRNEPTEVSPRPVKVVVNDRLCHSREKAPIRDGTALMVLLKQLEIHARLVVHMVRISSDRRRSPKVGEPLVGQRPHAGVSEVRRLVPAPLRLLDRVDQVGLNPIDRLDRVTAASERVLPVA